MSAPPVGGVVFIGAGPGSADLITLRGAARLREADVVLFDSLSDPSLRALAPDARWIDVGKRGFSGVPHAGVGADQHGGPGGGHPAAGSDHENAGQATIHALLVKHAEEGRRVVRLKGGDPGVFGRLEEELQALAAAGIACEIVPGVSAAMAAAAHTQRPLTRRGDGRTVGLATAMTRDGLVAGRHADTEVFYMAGKQLAALGRRLVAAGWPIGTPISVVSRAGWPDALASDHTVDTLDRAAMLHAGRPTVAIVGAGALPVAKLTGDPGRTTASPAQPATSHSDL